MAYVLGGKIKGETWIEARGVKHRILFTVNQIKQEPIVENIREPFPGHDRDARSPCSGPTTTWPRSTVERDSASLLTQFIWVNPHLTLHSPSTAKP